MVTLSQLRGNLTLSEAAKHLGISKSYLSLLENGKRRLNVDIAKNMASLYKVDIRQVIEAYINCKR